jgi:hypothetical protein
MVVLSSEHLDISSGRGSPQPGPTTPGRTALTRLNHRTGEPHAMAVFDQLRHPLIEKAVTDAREWCFGHELNGKPAFARATPVVFTLEEHLGAELTPELAAATLLHAARRFAPAELDVDDYLLTQYNGAVRRMVRALRDLDEAFAAGTPSVDTDDLQVLLACTADKIVALHLVLQQARESGDEARFFASQTELREQLPHLERFGHTITGRVPESMSRALVDVLAAVTACRTA